ncbi:unnamed protein product [Ectocarpus fasciculatus]
MVKKAKKNRLCADPACTRQPSFAAAGSKPEYCSAHRQKGMVDVRNKKCAHPGCTKNPTYGTEGTHTRIFCATHADQGMVCLSVKSRQARLLREGTPGLLDKKTNANLRTSKQSKSSADGRGRRGREDGLPVTLDDGAALHDSASERWRGRDQSFSKKHRSADQSAEPRKKRARRPEDNQLDTPLTTAAGDEPITAAVDTLYSGADSSGRWVSTGGNHWVFRPWGT